jgi:hypothetical protein
VGWSLITGLYAEREKLPDLTAALYRRLLARGTFDRAQIHGKYPGDPPRATFEYFSEEQLHSLVRDTLRPDSVEALHVELLYHLVNGEWLSLDIHLIGPQNIAGARVLQEGYLWVSIEENHIHRSDQELLAELGLPVVPYEELDNLGEDAIKMMFGLRREDVYKSAHELFFRVCGLSQAAQGEANEYSALGQCSDFEHAVMYSDMGLGSLVLCSAIFHRTPSEFARDLRRIYLEYNYGIYMPITLAPGADLDKTEFPSQDPKYELGIPGKSDPGYFMYKDHVTPGTNDLIEFLEGITEDKANKLRTLSDERIRELIAEMRATNAVPDVKVYDFGECGLMLFTKPLSSVWRVYEYIVKQNT